MEVAPNQMGKLDEKWVDEGARSVSQNDGLLLCEREVYSLCETVGKENQATVVDVIKRIASNGIASLTIEGSCLRGKYRIASSSKDQRVPV
jgi:hypothetical protein